MQVCSNRVQRATNGGPAVSLLYGGTFGSFSLGPKGGELAAGPRRLGHSGGLWAPREGRGTCYLQDMNLRRPHWTDEGPWVGMGPGSVHPACGRAGTCLGLSVPVNEVARLRSHDAVLGGMKGCVQDRLCLHERPWFQK